MGYGALIPFGSPQVINPNGEGYRVLQNVGGQLVYEYMEPADQFEVISTPGRQQWLRLNYDSSEESDTTEGRSYYQRAQDLEGMDYCTGGDGTHNCIDCSGLVVYATQSQRDWSTRDNTYPPGSWNLLLNPVTSSLSLFSEGLMIGDLLVWYPANTSGHHAAFWAGENALFSARGDDENGWVGFTGGSYNNGLGGLSWWWDHVGVPFVFRQR